MVASILGLLTALLFTAIQAGREAARRTQCSNKMGEIGRALQQFEMTQRHYPGWRHYPFHAVDATTGLPVTFSTSWFPQLLPYLSRNDVFQPGLAGSWKTPVVSGGIPFGFVPNVRSLAVCPSDGQKMSSRNPVMSYVVNTGRRDRRPSTSFPADWRSNGIFLDLLSWRGNPSNSVMVQTCDSTFILRGDGLNDTLMVSENYDAGRWNAIRESREGFIFYPPGTRPTHYINSPSQPGGPTFLNARPASYHVGGVNVVFAGGNGRFLRQDLNYAVYCALMTPRGESAREPGSLQPSAPSIIQQPPIVFP